MKYSCLIFDLDGTLSDPVLGIERCMNFALTRFNHPPRARHEITPYIGPPLEQALGELSGNTDEQYVTQLVATYRERYGEFGFAENTLYDGIIEMLQALTEQGYRLGVCTSKVEIYANKVLENFDLLKFFDFISGTKQRESKGAQLGQLLKDGIIDQDALMIGDRNVDLIAARANDLGSAGVLWGYGSMEELTGEQPSLLVKSPAELVDVLAKP